MSDTNTPATNESEAETPTETVVETTVETTVETEVDPQHLRLLEAVLFSATDPLTEDAIAERLPNDAQVTAALAQLREIYANRGVTLVSAGGRWFFRTADDLSEQLRVHMKVQRKLSRAAMETLAIIAYHQPVTRAEIEEVRGVGLSKGTLDALFEAGWIAPKGRRRTAGRPVTWGTTNGFLTTFGLDMIGDLPGLDDLKAAGLLDKRPAIQITDTQENDPEEEEDEALTEEDLLDMDRPDPPDQGLHALESPESPDDNDNNVDESGDHAPGDSGDANRPD